MTTASASDQMNLAASGHDREERRTDDPRVIFVLGELHSEASGVGRIVCDLASAAGRLGAPVTVYSTVLGSGNGSQAEGIVRSVRPPSRCTTRRGLRLGRLSYSPELRSLLHEVMPEVDVVHNQSMWTLPNHYASAAARRHGKPVMFTAMGYLEPWALARSRWKKRVAGALFQNRELRRAACIQVNSEAEMKGVRAYGLRNPVAIVPNGVDLSLYREMPDRRAFEAAFPGTAGKRVCLFLSRLHVKKGLEHLLEAWSRLSAGFPDWQLVIAGPDDGFEAQARRLVSGLGIDGSVTMTGPLYGERKLQALSAASFFALPSFSEGFPMALLEAMAAGAPVLYTPGCNFAEIEGAGAGVMVRPTVDDTERGLRRFLEMSDAESAAMGHNARRLIESGYTWEQVARQMLGVYRWLAGGGAAPDCVVTS